MIRQQHDLSLEEQEAHRAKNGGFNDFPPKWREITAAEFAKSRHFTFYPALEEYRQMFRPVRGDAPCVSAHLFWQSDGTGYAIVNDYWGGTIKFYAFGERPSDLVENFDSSD